MPKKNFKNIRNNQEVNIENCADEPIRFPGAIQANGFLLAIDPITKIISVCSQNCTDFIGVRHDNLLSQEISVLESSSLMEALITFQKGKELFFTTVCMVFDQTYSVRMHQSGPFLIIEFELAITQFDLKNDYYSSSKQLISYIEDTNTLVDLTDAIAKAIKEITNYDRVMIYRFDPSYNGEVIAEAKEPDLEPFLGYHYPHTDIPEQARELYLKNQLRLVGDVNYEASPLFMIPNTGHDTLDLSHANLRSVSPIHIEYLKNMKVGATLTISLIHKKRLWGLIACHHKGPKFLSEEIKSAVKLHGHFITSQIDIRLLNEELEIATATNQSLNTVINSKHEGNRASLVQLMQNKAILNLCNSDGCIALIGEDVFTLGKTPTAENAKRLALFLSEYSNQDRFYTNSLRTVSKDLLFISEAFPGVSYYSLQNDLDCIIWFRIPTIKNISWAGTPIAKNATELERLTPRKSFDIFVESIKDQSLPWLESERAASDSFHNFLQIHLRSILLFEEKESQRKLSEILQETNAELENINWISSHDLQEPLRKIRMMASTLVGGDELEVLPLKVQEKIIKMQNSAERMQNLISDILKYTKTGHQQDQFENVDLNKLFAELNEEELSESFDTDKTTLEVAILPAVRGLPFLIKQLFSNIIRNSLKFKSPDRDLIIKIKQHYEPQEGSSSFYNIIEITDNGIGFDNIYKEKIFKIFSRLNKAEDYDGSGVGLALCKKIMGKHQGIITADGILGEGVTVRLYFPKH